MTRAVLCCVLCAAIKNVVGEKSANKRAFIKLELYLPKSEDSLRACESLVKRSGRRLQPDEDDAHDCEEEMLMMVR